jgi:hypothetical protein
VLCKTKNVTGWHRILRVVGGASLAIVGWQMFREESLGYVLMAVGAMALMTGLVGFCPACCMVGRDHTS